MNPPRWRAHFVEPQLLFSTFLIGLLERAGLDVVRTDAALDLRALEAGRPDVLVLDASDPARDYHAVVSAARTRVPGLRVIAWADSSLPLFDRLRSDGVSAISYDLEPADTVAAIRAALESLN